MLRGADGATPAERASHTVACLRAGLRAIEATNGRARAMQQDGAMSNPTKPDDARTEHHAASGHYGRLLVMMVLSFGAMYVLMYAMVDTFDHVYSSFNQLYMAGLMTAAMIVLELLLMWRMYPNRAVNGTLLAVGALALVACFVLIRQQSVIHDRQFLKSMIPHHAGAILMCERAELDDPEVRELCTGIIAGQLEEIEQMQAKLGELGR
jgi:hypothetical protein